ncbi:protein CONSERVED ONLY IN THE GREEN LINEAGE 160, chloroplastic [Trifolium repens]|nr:protein CONSERVED ONLY IN THE GREEN LINEAGE 160, chloroplastic [Trifolium repens]
MITSLNFPHLMFYELEKLQLHNIQQAGLLLKVDDKDKVFHKYSYEIAARFGAGFLGSLAYTQMLGSSMDSRELQKLVYLFD